MEITTAEAAALLAVSDGEVRRLLRERLVEGRRLGNMWLVDAASVHRRRRLDLARGRAWAPRVAFGALLVLAGRSDAGLSDSELSRLRRGLRASQPSDVVRRARELMTSERWRVPASRLDRLVAAAGVFITAESAVESISDELESHMPDTSVTHLGVASADVERVRAASGARGASESANVVVHIVRTDLADRLDDERVQEVITAVVLGTSEDARVRTAAMKHLSDCLSALTARGRA